ncbi:hypothetical protein [Paenibacillus sp. FSL R5-0345]|uniref:hypothetical protein n=1 Tax=Paenibacillus sp. FSL R5-0345 TaxID=1536770 RepID=UPI000A4E5244|nr:hypothetical protein [Paenibacillus sp. FSL R5-0345]
MALITGDGVESAVVEFVAIGWEVLLLLEQLVIRSIDNIAEAIRRLPEILGLKSLRVKLVIRKVVPS